jgi:hypothetical protein
MSNLCPIRNFPHAAEVCQSFLPAGFLPAKAPSPLRCAGAVQDVGGFAERGANPDVSSYPAIAESGIEWLILNGLQFLELPKRRFQYTFRQSLNKS